MSHETRSILNDRCIVHVGDCLDVMRSMPSDSVDCVVTSPPYWGLRDYGVEGQIGLEPTLAEHLKVMVAVFEEVRRILKPTGTCWVNYGDCYATTPNGRSAAGTKTAANGDGSFRDKSFSTIGGNIKPKDLLMIPNRLAIALQDAGWWVRAECVWGKANPMPDSSGSARPSTAHEKVFMLTKTADGDIWRARDTGELSFAPDLSEQCPLVTRPEKLANRWVRIGSYYDAEAVTMACSPNTNARVSQDVANQVGSSRANGGAKTNGPMKAVVRGRSTHGRHTMSAALPETERRKEAKPGTGTKNNSSFNEALVLSPNRRYLRNYEPAPLDVWPITTQPFSEAHFATFPPELAERCILAGCPRSGTVLDPFGGAGTTALVALRHGRSAQLIELNPEYADITCRRIEKEWKVQRQPKQPDHGPLFAGGAA